MTRTLCELCAEPVVQALQEKVMNSIAAGTAPMGSAYERLASTDQRFTADAFRFIGRAVCAALSAADSSAGDHVSGRDVAEAFRLLALRELGTSALSTLESWGIRSPDDVGAVVFRMIEGGMFGARPEDKPEDFQSLYDFAAAFPTGRNESALAFEIDP